MKKKAYMNWSGGKDSSMALHRILKDKQWEVETLLTTVNSTYNRVSMHGVRVDLLEKQAKSIGIPSVKVELSETVSMAEYSAIMAENVGILLEKGMAHSIFGDIFLEDLKQYREKELEKVGITGVFPIWKESTTDLMQSFIDLGFKAIIVCVNERYLDKSFCGRLIDNDLIKDLPEGVDICGENGEYHSFVFDGPIFSTPIAFEIGEMVHRTYKPSSESDSNNCATSNDTNWDLGFWYCDIVGV